MDSKHTQAIMQNSQQQQQSSSGGEESGTATATTSDNCLPTTNQVLAQFVKELKETEGRGLSMTSSISASTTSIESLIGRKFYRDAPKR